MVYESSDVVCNNETWEVHRIILAGMASLSSWLPQSSPHVESRANESWRGMGYKDCC